MNDKSGLTMALDLEFLLAGLTGERRANGSPSADGNDGPQSRIPALLRRTNEGRASETVVIQRAPRGVGWLQEFIAEICADKMLHDRAAETLGEPVLGLAPFLMHWANSRFGMRTTVGLNLWTLHQALVAHRSRSVEAATVMLFLELPETPQLNRMLSFYLHCRAYVSNEIVAIEPPRGEAARSDNTNSPSRRLKDSRGARGLGGGGGGSFSDSFSGSLAGSFRLSSGPGMPQGAGAGSPADSFRTKGSAATGEVAVADGSGGASRQPVGRQRRGGVFTGSAIAPTAEGQGTGIGSAWEEKATDLIRAELRRDREVRRVLLLSRAWEAAQHLFQPAPGHILQAVLRELQAAATLFRKDVPPPMRSLMPLEQHVVDFEHFMLTCTVFFDLSTRLHTIHAKDQSMRQRQQKTGSALVDHPLAAASLAVLRRSMALGDDGDEDAKEQMDRLQPQSFSHRKRASGGLSFAADDSGAMASVLERAGPAPPA